MVGLVKLIREYNNSRVNIYPPFPNEVDLKVFCIGKYLPKENATPERIAEIGDHLKRIFTLGLNKDFPVYYRALPRYWYDEPTERVIFRCRFYNRGFIPPKLYDMIPVLPRSK